MIRKVLKYPYRALKGRYLKWDTIRYVSHKVESQRMNADSFDYNLFKQTVIRFLASLKVDDSGFRFKYSANCSAPTLYASVYACMTYSLLGELRNNEILRSLWINHLDSFQNSEDGLWYDPNVQNEYYNDSDWWGARHLAVHMISAYTQLGAKPKHQLKFLKRYYDEGKLNSWLSENEGMFLGEMNNDFDNKLMNISCLLQYQRDTWNDRQAGSAVRTVLDFLHRKINPATGIWGDLEIENTGQRSRKVQFAYHLFPAFFYDGIFDFDMDKISKVTIQTQNQYGGFGVKPNSSACDDIDSVDILIRAHPFAKQYHDEILNTLKKGMNWILANQMDDGGFVFRLNEPFEYGHPQLASPKNVGAVFPTWFRTLSLAYLCKFLKIPAGFTITRSPGYEF